MQFLLTDLRNHRHLQKQEQINPNPFLGTPPDFVEFKAPLEARVQAELIQSDVLVTGEVSTVFTCSCARCLNNFDKPVTSKFKQTVDPVDNVVDVDYLIKEAVILDLPLKAVCREECLGLCPVCGKNKNEADCGCEVPTGAQAWDVLKNIQFPKIKGRKNG